MYVLVLKPRLITLIALAMNEKPVVLVVDSIQVMHVNDVDSAPGSVSQ